MSTTEQPDELLAVMRAHRCESDGPCEHDCCALYHALKQFITAREKAVRLATLMEARNAACEFCAEEMLYDDETEWHEDFEGKRFVCYVPNIRELIERETKEA